MAQKLLSKSDKNFCQEQYTSLKSDTIMPWVSNNKKSLKLERWYYKTKQSQMQY